MPKSVHGKYKFTAEELRGDGKSDPGNPFPGHPELDIILWPVGILLVLIIIAMAR
jgi:hypothetical protein